MKTRIENVRDAIRKTANLNEAMKVVNEGLEQMRAKAADGTEPRSPAEISAAARHLHMVMKDYHEAERHALVRDAYQRHAAKLGDS